MVISDISYAYNRIAQNPNGTESVSNYAIRLIGGLQAIHICADKDFGSGSQWSGQNVPASTYPMYQLRGEFRETLEFKQRFIAGACSQYQTAYAQHCGGRKMISTQLVCSTFEDLVEWFETEYQNHISRSGPNRVSKSGNSTMETVDEGESDSSNPLNSFSHNPKRSKFEENKIADRSEEMMSALALQSKMMVQVLERLIPSTSSSGSSSSGYSSSTHVPQQHRLFAISQGSQRSGKKMFRPPSNSAQKVCWICKGTHYATQCPLISRLELLILLRNRVYRTNRSNPNTSSHITIDSLLIAENLKPMTSEETTLITSIYKPLEDKDRKITKGLNPSAYCHYCHAIGHWTRDCLEFCPYCLKVGHGWKSCTESTYAGIIQERKSSMGDLHAIDYIFTLCNAFNEDNSYCSD